MISGYRTRIHCLGNHPVEYQRQVKTYSSRTEWEERCCKLAKPVHENSAAESLNQKYCKNFWSAPTDQEKSRNSGSFPTDQENSGSGAIDQKNSRNSGSGTLDQKNSESGPTDFNRCKSAAAESREKIDRTKKFYQN